MSKTAAGPENYHCDSGFQCAFVSIKWAGNPQLSLTMLCGLLTWFSNRNKLHERDGTTTGISFQHVPSLELVQGVTNTSLSPCHTMCHRKDAEHASQLTLCTPKRPNASKRQPQRTPVNLKNPSCLSYVCLFILITKTLSCICFSQITYPNWTRNSRIISARYF